MRRSLQFVLFGLNVAFWVVGSAMLGIGIWLAVDADTYEAVGAATGAAMNEGVWTAAVCTLIVVGALLFVVGFFGCIGAARADRNTCLLWTYLVSISLIIVLEIVVIVLVAVYWTSIDAELAVRMYRDVRNNYVNETSADETSSSWNRMQENWKCCGSYNYTDYFGSNYDNDTTIDQIKVPYTCCENQVEIKQRLECQNGNEDFIHLQGCYGAYVERVNHNAPVVIGVTSAFVALHITGLVIACVLVIMKRRKDYIEYTNAPSAMT